MKKILSVLAILLMFVNVSACNKKQEPEIEIPEIVKSNKILVVYFSHTGNTQKLVDYVVEKYDCDTYRIEAKDEYTKEDTQYDSSTRAYKEQHDPTCRPEIKNELPDLSDYDTIFLAYPIWHGYAPKIIYTFLESVDVANKRIIPFCTSAESPLGDSVNSLKEIKPEASWDEGIRFKADAEKEEFVSWLDTLNIK